MKIEPIEKYKPWEVKTKQYRPSYLFSEGEIFFGSHAVIVDTKEEVFLYISKQKDE